MSFIKKHRIYIILILVILLILLLTYKDYGIGWHEVFYDYIGKFYLNQILNFFGLKTNIVLGEFIPTEIHIKSHGVIFDVLKTAGSFFLEITASLQTI